MTQTLPAPLDVKLMNLTASVLFVGCVLLVLAAGAWWVLRYPGFAIARIVVQGELVHNNAVTLRANVAPHLVGNFFTVDLRAAREAGFKPIKLNMVVQADVNLDEVQRMVTFAIEQGFVLRLIEPMPVGDTGRATQGVDLSKLGEQLAAQHGLVPEIMGQGAGPARYWCTPDRQMSLGVITPMSQHFCEACNRVRLGVWVLIFLGVFTIIAWRLNAAFWKDIK